ncbi:MAG: hypothetical protein GX351_10355 [Peptococcaceae bacterium]|nr:hypothetical protein [Peptococcaceae bacterium]
MCWSCNPYCGNCKPPKPKPRQCLQCKAYTIDPERDYCRKCGAKLPDHVPPPIVKCEYSGMMCANPCGKYKKPSLDGKYTPCKLNTPPPADSL